MLPSHWWFNGPSKPRVASELFRMTRVRGGYAATYRRLIRVGPWSFAVIRYRPGDDPTERCATSKPLARGVGGDRLCS